jgi:hypothetical protein
MPDIDPSQAPDAAPALPPSTLPAPRVPSGAPAPDPFQQGPATADTISAAFRQDNPISSVLDSIGQMPGNEYDPTHNPLDTLKGTPHEGDDLSIYAGSPNEGYTRALMARLDRQRTDQETLAQSGHAGTVASLAAGILDPTLAIPILGEAHEAGALANIGRMAALGTAQGVASEGLMQESQVGRTWQESAGNIASDTIMMGVLGGAIGALSKGERGAMAGALDEVRPRVDGTTGEMAPQNPIVQRKMADGSLEPDDPFADRRKSDAEEEAATRPRIALRDLLQSGSSDAASPFMLPDGKIIATGNDHMSVAGPLEARAANFVRFHYFPDSLNVSIVDGQTPTPKQLSTLGQLMAAKNTDGARQGIIELNDSAGNSLQSKTVTSPEDLIDTIKGWGERGNPAPINRPIGPQSTLMQAAGAAGADTRELNPIGALGLEKIPVSPNMRIYTGDSASAKQALRDLAETAIRFEPDQVAPNGQPLESIVRVQKNQSTVALHDALESNWLDHYYGSDTHPNGATAALGREGIGAPTTADKLSYSDFKDAVYNAGISGDVHQIPEVQKAMQELRAQVMDPIKELAQNTKGPDGNPMLSEELGPPKGAQSFMPMMPKRDAIIANWNKTRGMFSDYMESEQTEKAAAQDRLSQLQERHEALGSQIGKLDGRLDTATAAQQQTGTRLDERGMEARTTEARAGTLQDRAGEIRSGISELEEFVGNMRGQLRDPASQERLDDLEGQISQLRKQSSPMSEAALKQTEREEVKSALTGDLRKAAEIFVGKRKSPVEPDMLKWMAKEGGIVDTGGDVKAILGGGGPKGILADTRQTALSGMHDVARTADDWGERFYEMAPWAFPEGRPSPNDVRDIIEQAARGHAPDWFHEVQGNGERALNNLTDELGTVANELGADPKSLREVAEMLNGMRGRDPLMLQRLRDRVDAGHDLVGAQADLASRQQGRQDLRDLISRAIEDRGTQEGALSREGARASEAQSAANRNQGRVGLLSDRLTRQQTMQDLLEAARQNAEDERISIRGKIEDEIRAWKGDTTADAVSVLKARDEAERVRGLKQSAGVYEGKGERLTSADSPVDRAVRQIINSHQDLSRPELESRADEWINRWIGSPDGRLPYDAGSGGPNIGYTGSEGQQVRGSLNQRTMTIPVKQLAAAGLIHTDVEHAVGSMIRTLVPDIQLTARFGDVDMTNAFRKIREEYQAKIGPDTTAKEAAKIIVARDRDLTDLAAVRDRFRGVYGWDPSPQARKFGNVIRDAQNLSALSSLGTSVINRLTDLGANATFRYAFQDVFSDVWKPLFSAMAGDPEIAKIAKAQSRDMGVGVDGLLGHMRQNLHDVNDLHSPGNRFSRGLAWATDKSMLINLHGPWTDWMKAMSWNVAQGEFGRVSKRIADALDKGIDPSAKDLARMADANISPQMASRISQQYEANHTLVKGAKFANTSDWTDKEAKTAFEAAMSREANINVVTSGIGDKPLWMSSKIGGLMGQFKGFVAGAHEKILISNIQQRDGRALQGALVSIAMGMMSYRMYALASGQDVSQNPADWVKEGITRSAMPGWLNEANQLASKGTGGMVDYGRLFGATMPNSRRRDNSLLSDIMGPTYSRVEQLTGAASHIVSGKASSADIHQARMALPLQNLMGFRRLLDEVEDGAANVLGMKPRQRNGPQWLP